MKLYLLALSGKAGPIRPAKDSLLTLSSQPDIYFWPNRASKSLKTLKTWREMWQNPYVYSLPYMCVCKCIGYCKHERIHPCNKMFITYIMFIESESNFTKTLWIHIWLTKIIHILLGLPDHVLIILQKLAIFAFESI